MKRTSNLKMRRLLTAAAAAICLLVRVPAAPADSAPVNTASAEPAEPVTAPLRLLYSPVLGRDATLSRYQPFTDHLSRSLGLPVAAESLETNQDIRVPLARGQFDLAYLTPTLYKKAEPYSRFTVLAMELDAAGNRGYHSIIICRSDRPYLSVAAAKSAVLAFTNFDSASGFEVPLIYFLKELKETPATFAGKVVFAGNHPELIKGVDEGKFDLGATNDMDFSRTLEAENLPAADFRELWRSELIPGAVICVRSDLPPDRQAAILKAILDFNQDPDGLKALQIGGLAPATAADYAPLRALSALTEQ